MTVPSILNPWHSSKFKPSKRSHCGTRSLLSFKSASLIMLAIASLAGALKPNLGTSLKFYKF